MKTTITNGRWMIGVAASIFGVVMMFLGWVANDNLAGIRSDIKEAKGMLITIQRDTDKLGIDVGYLKAWKVEVEEHIKKGGK